MFTKKSSLLKLLSTALISITLLSFVGCSFLTSVFGNDDENSNSSGTTENQNNQNTSSDENSNTSGDSNSDGDSNKVATDLLNGTWVSAYYETFIIDETAKTFDAGSTSYAGDNLTIVYTTTDSGYIYFKYTRAYESTTEDMSSDSTWTYSSYTESYYRYSTSAPDVGKWYAVSFKDLTSTSVSLSGAYLYSGKTSTDTLDEAKTEFTIAKEYYSYYSECTKSN